MIGYCVYYFQESIPMKKSHRDNWNNTIVNKVNEVYARPRIMHL